MSKEKKSSSEIIRETIELKSLIAEEIYYGINLGFVMNDATQEERDTIRRVFERARDYRAQLKNKRDVVVEGKKIGSQG